MVVPRIRRVSRIAAVAGAAAALSLLGPGLHPGVRAAGTVGDPLAGPFVDVAFAGSSGAAPVLLAVRPFDPHEPGSVRLTLLARVAGAWSVAAALDVPTGIPEATRTWLVPLDGDGMALVALDAGRGRTAVVLLGVESGAIRRSGGLTLVGSVGGAGALDLAGSGRRALVLALPPAVGDGAPCPSTRLIAIDPATASVRSDVSVERLDLLGAAAGRVGGPGDRLVAYAIRTCDRGPSHPVLEAVVAVDPSTGRAETALDLAASDLGVAVSGGQRQPLLADLDGDGRAEAIVRDGVATVVLDPAAGWRREVLAPRAVPLGALPGAGRPRLVAVEVPGDPVGPGPRVDLLAAGRLRPGGPLVERTVASIPVGVVGDPLGPAPDPAAPPPVWIGDLEGSGCLDLLVPRATLARCDGPAAGTWVPTVGPAWTATVPIAAYGPRGARRLLVAAGLDWSAAAHGVVVPAPAAASAVLAAGWRSGPSARFVLQELDAGDVRYFSTFPTPSTDIDPGPGGSPDLPEAIVGGTAGDRLFVRFAPVAGGAATGQGTVTAPGGPTPLGSASPGPPGPVPSGAAAALAFLADPPPAALQAIAAIPVPAGSTAGANLGSARVRLPLDGRPVAWEVDAVAVNAYGELAGPVHARVEVDRTGPNLVVDQPIVLAPWPFSAPIRGTTEPGASVRIAAGQPVEVAATGDFVLRAQLAPWPQEVVVQAVDRRGNVTVQTVSLVGGVDYRRLPWQTILVAATLLGAAMTTWRGPGPLVHGGPARRSGDRPARGLAPSRLSDALGTSPGRPRWPPAGEPVAEIEDLPPGPSRSG